MTILLALLCHPQTGLLSSSHALQTSVLANLLSNVTPIINIIIIIIIVIIIINLLSNVTPIINIIVVVILVIEKKNKCLQCDSIETHNLRRPTKTFGIMLVKKITFFRRRYT